MKIYSNILGCKDYTVIDEVTKDLELFFDAPVICTEPANLENYPRLIQAADKLSTFLKENSVERDWKITVITGRHFDQGTIRVEAVSLEFSDTGKFYEIISSCDIVEIYALTNGNMMLDLNYLKK